MRGLLLALLGACGSPAPPEAIAGPDGIAIHSVQPVSRVEVLGPDGAPLQTWRPARPLSALEVPVPWRGPGTYTAKIRTADGEISLAVEVDPASASRITVSAPIGQDPVAVEEGDRIAVPLLDQTPATVAVTVRAMEAGPASVRIGEALTEVARLGPGERMQAQAEIRVDTPVEVAVGAELRRFTLAPDPISGEALRRDLSLSAVRLPAERDGSVDLSRTAGRVDLAAEWWLEGLDGLGLGSRAADPWAPWAWVAVDLHNAGPRPINLVVQLRIEDLGGQPAPAFQPRLRESGDGSGQVRTLIRVPAEGDATATLPLFVDPAALPEALVASTTWTRVVEILPLGAAAPLHTARAPLVVHRGSTVASAGFGITLLAALGGAGILARGLPRWLGRSATGELMTTALFGALIFLVGAVGQLVAMGLGALTRWLLAGVAMGSFSPTDLLYLSCRVFWYEGALWLVGLTRGEGWRQQRPLARWARLSAGFGLASLLDTATGLVLSVVLYRLFLAPWYVAMVLLGPGLLYVVGAAALAVPFADGLRRVQR